VKIEDDPRIIEWQENVFDSDEGTMVDGLENDMILDSDDEPITVASEKGSLTPLRAYLGAVTLPNLFQLSISTPTGSPPLHSPSSSYYPPPPPSSPLPH
jgi:hypothetical protein